MSKLLMHPTRYAHSEGHLDMTFDDVGRHLLTCGPDGDLRIYEGFDDDDPVSHRIGEVVTSVAFKKDRFFAAGDENTIQAYTFKEGEPDGIILRFMAPVTHMTFNRDGTKLLAASSDFTVKLVEVGTSNQKVFEGHDAPVLSVALHPKEHMLASSSCDGTIRIWMVEDQKCVKTIPGLPKNNDFATAAGLCRLTWDKDGKYLVIPMGTEVRVYDTTSWQISFILTDSSIVGNVSVTQFSPCWQYLGAACRDGVFVFWDFSDRRVVTRTKHEKGHGITALRWNPKEKAQVAYCDNNGYLGLIDNVVSDTVQKKPAAAPVDNPLSDLFDDGDDDMLIEATNPQDGAATAADIADLMADGDDDDDDDEIDIGALKKKFMPIDETSQDTDAGSVAPSEEGSKVVMPPPRVEYRGYEPTPLQPPFQSSSTPVHLSHRFMVWNSVGIILQYNTDEENSINIEFHDTAVHHAMHVNNVLGHTIAALSNEAALLACEGDEDSPSKAVCMHFASWDSNKEWSVDMPSGEDIKAVCLGEGWLAIATDKRTVRLFTVGGVQRELFSVPGPIVTLAAHSNQLMVIYHAGMGIPGEQNLGIRLQSVSTTKCATKLNGEPLSLSPRSTLAWAGFSAEGTPFYMDSSGVIRMLNRTFANSWLQVANLRKQCKGKSDNYWICGIHENPQQIRAILCKGSKYPPTLPRPTVQIMSYQLPLCEISSDKGTLEESLWRSRVMSQHLDWWDSQGFEVDDSVRNEALMPQQESLMKLFALACKSDREVRAVEICQLMPNQHTVQLAIKYASRLRMIQLAQRLNEVAREKAEAEAIKAQRDLLKSGALVAEEDEDGEEEENFRQFLDNGHSHVDTEWSHESGHKPKPPKTAPPRDEEVEDNDEEDDANMSADIYEEIEQEEEKPKTPLLMFGANKSKQTTPRSISSSQNALKNPFKIASQQSTPNTGKGTSVFDSMSKSKSNRPGENQKGKTPEPKLKPSAIKLKKQSTSQSPLNMANKKQTTPEKSSESRVNKSGFQLWFEENRATVETDNPDVADVDLTLVAAKAFKQLSKEEQQEWNKKAKDNKCDEDNRKRKRDGEDQENIESSSKVMKSKNIGKSDPTSTGNTSSKLKAFAFGK